MQAEARAVVFSGGWAHDFATTTPMVVDAIGDPVGNAVITDDPAELAAKLADGVELLVVHACRFRMLDDRYTPAQRDEFAMSLPRPTRQSIAAHVRRGGGMLAVHTATVCFDDWPQWAGLLGGRWSWDRSFHPPPALIEVRVTADHPVTDGVENFEVVDERYTNLDVDPASTVLAVSPAPEGDQPIVWVSEANGGRVVHSSLGHDGRSLAHPAHCRLLAQSAAWAVAAGQDGVDA